MKRGLKVAVFLVFCFTSFVLSMKRGLKACSCLLASKRKHDLDSQWKEDWKYLATKGKAEEFLAPSQWKEDWKRIFTSFGQGLPGSNSQWKEDWKLKAELLCVILEYILSMKRGLKVGCLIDQLQDSKLLSMKRGLKGPTFSSLVRVPKCHSQWKEDWK